MTWPKKTYLPTYLPTYLHTYSPTYLHCDTRQSCRLVTIETLITILTIENINSWQFLLPDNQEWQWTAYAILAMFSERVQYSKGIAKSVLIWWSPATPMLSIWSCLISLKVERGLIRSRKTINVDEGGLQLYSSSSLSGSSCFWGIGPFS